MSQPRMTILYRLVALSIASTMLGGCVTSRIENVREGATGIKEGEGIVIMAKSYHLGNETEAKFIDCVGNSIGSGSTGLRVVPNDEFVDALFPWFEPRTAPAETKGLPTLMARPGVAQKIKDKASDISSGSTVTPKKWPVAEACPVPRGLVAAVVSVLHGGRMTPSMKPVFGILMGSRKPALSAPMSAAHPIYQRSSYRFP